MDAVLQALGEQLGQAMIAIGMTAESNAKQEITKAVYDTPESKSGYVRTGRLRNSITYGVDTSEPAVYIGSNVEYAPYVELGTSKMRARPFLKPAVENYGEQYKELLQQAMKS
jgi:HK97 gp10 family phage protein